MKIQWLGDASFLLPSDSGTRIITDPYTPGAFGLDYAPVAAEADVVTVSHEHADPNDVAGVKGKPQIVRPMHFQNDRCPNFPVTGVDDFVALRSSVKRIDGSEVTVRKEELPATVETVVLRPAR